METDLANNLKRKSIEMKIKTSHILSTIALAGLLQSCKVTETYQKPGVKADWDKSLFRKQTNVDSLSMAKVAWNQIFADDKLQNIIKKTIANNYDLKIAVTRINEADAVFKQSQLNHLPTIDGIASIKDTKNSAAAQGSNFRMPDVMNFQLGVSAGWEVDIWGKMAAMKRSAYAGFLQTDAARRAVQTQLVAQAASLYYQLLSLDKQLAITKQTVYLRIKNVEAVQLLMDAAYLTGADVEQSKANLYSAQLMIPDLEIQIQQTENALNLLMGEAPKDIERNSIDSQVVSTDFRTGLPASLLQNRPDVLSAEMAFRQAFENKNVALAQVYPSLNITAALGLSSKNIKDFFNESLFYTVGGTLTQNIFQQGNRKAQVKITEARKEQAYLNFEKTLLKAGAEVSDALVTYEKAKSKEATRQLQIESLQKALDFSNELLTYSSKVNYVNVLTAEQALLEAQLSAVNDKLQQLQAMTEFYRALGGGQF